MAHAADDGTITLVDLEAMAVRKEWTELLTLLPSIDPADRTSKWDGIVEQAAVGHLKAIAVDNPSEAVVVGEELVKAFPALGRSRPFEDEYNGIAFSGFETCFSLPSSAPQCVDKLNTFVRKGRNIPELAFRAGQLVGQKRSSEEAIPFFVMAIGPLTRAAYCADTEVKRALLAGFLTTEEATFRKALKLAEKDCWGTFRPELILQMERTPASLSTKRICILFNVKKFPSKKCRP